MSDEGNGWNFAIIVVSELLGVIETASLVLVTAAAVVVADAVTVGAVAVAAAVAVAVTKKLKLGEMRTRERGKGESKVGQRPRKQSQTTGVELPLTASFAIIGQDALKYRKEILERALQGGQGRGRAREGRESEEDKALGQDKEGAVTATKSQKRNVKYT